MTEAEWLACQTPRQLFEALDDRVSERKLRLYACACCRAVWKYLRDPKSRQAVEAAERFADEQVDAATLAGIYRAAQDVYHALKDKQDTAPFALAAAETARATFRVGRQVDAQLALCQALAVYSANLKGNIPVELLRELFGNPYQTVTIDPSWLSRNDGVVLRLAREIYEQRAFERMGKLADALKAAGCDNQQLLDHCRQRGSHVLGCWALDLILGTN